MIEYPKISQEQLEAACSLILNTTKDSTYLLNAPYSALMLKKIKDLAEKFEKELGNNSTPMSTTGKTQEEIDQEITADINKQFSVIGENIESKSEEHQDRFRILVRIERVIRNLETLAKTSKSDQTKLSATTKLMEQQEEQLKILERLMNLEKAQRIENLTRRFFIEISKTEKLKEIGGRYLKLLNELD